MKQPDDTESVMQGIAKVVDQCLNRGAGPKIGFAVLVFTTDGHAGARTNFVSNCDRADMLAALKEVVARFEGQSLQKGHA